eukprot:CAMPEP_0119403318 /NCGR_PEP_ID=MMETSP1334-20130426/143321_1 /TAXON_ID=127549 /ORGANISM="Calcidiscus leptoporus, Strain RCC1130" /LENGTH=100 /DNA_ID=CAMNT_0007427263 /DNA_START=416 /DNA_END=718 /DNA_ORIENTATION=+
MTNAAALQMSRGRFGANRRARLKTRTRGVASLPSILAAAHAVTNAAALQMSRGRWIIQWREVVVALVGVFGHPVSAGRGASCRLFTHMRGHEISYMILEL